MTHISLNHLLNIVQVPKTALTEAQPSQDCAKNVLIEVQSPLITLVSLQYIPQTLDQILSVLVADGCQTLLL